MTEGQHPAPIDPENLPRPEEVHPREGQRVGDPRQSLVSQEIIDEGVGLHPVPLMQSLHAVIRLSRQVGPVLAVIFRDVDRRLRRADHIQEALTDERIARSVLEERLRHSQMLWGAHAFLIALGGAFLGFALPELKKDPTWFDGMICLIGLAMLVVGCWPILFAWSGKTHPKEAEGKDDG